VSAPRRARGLVTRLGGPARVRALLALFYARLAQDPLVGFFFAGKNLDAIIDGQLAFLSKVSGEAPVYRGRHPAQAHLGLPPIRRGQFDRRLVVLRETLEEAGVDPVDVEAWVGIERSLRGRIERRR
jgi:hemoglobin